MSVTYEQDVGHHMQAMQASKAALHEHEENLYEIIPDNSVVVATHSPAPANHVRYSNGTMDRRMTSIMGSAGHETIAEHTEQNGGVNTIASHHVSSYASFS